MKKLTESKLRRIIQEEARRIFENRRFENVVNKVQEKLRRQGFDPKAEGDTIEVRNLSLVFVRESPVHLTVNVSGRGMYREFQFDIQSPNATAEEIMQRINPFL